MKRWRYMRQPTILIVDDDVLVRHELAEYLRECGYQVVEAANAGEARLLLDKVETGIDLMLADVSDDGGEGFELARWARAHHPDVDVVLAGSVKAAARKAGDLCDESPPISKPYDHQLVEDRIRRLVAEREQQSAQRGRLTA